MLAVGFSEFDPSVWTGRALQAGCASVSGPCMERLCSGHHGYPRAPDLILGEALRGRLGHQITGATARPFLHFLNPTRRPRVGYLLVLLVDARFVAACLHQHGPGDPRGLLASAVARTLWCKRCAAAVSHGPKLCPAQFAGRAE